MLFCIGAKQESDVDDNTSGFGTILFCIGAKPARLLLSPDRMVWNHIVLHRCKTRADGLLTGATVWNHIVLHRCKTGK